MDAPHIAEAPPPGLFLSRHNAGLKCQLFLQTLPQTGYPPLPGKYKPLIHKCFSFFGLFFAFCYKQQVRRTRPKQIGKNETPWQRRYHESYENLYSFST
jgi:hypothetical protein